MCRLHNHGACIGYTESEMLVWTILVLSAYCQCSEHTDQPSKREGKGLLCEAVTLVLHIKLRQNISAAHTCEAFTASKGSKGSQELLC